jgi:prephenate dehydrogenase
LILPHKMKIKKNILIIGFGKMGFSHFTSLQNDRFHYKIDIFDSNKKQYEKKIIKNKKKKYIF